MPKFRVGDRVRCERKAPARGSWARYAGRAGVVSVTGMSGEIGVQLTASSQNTWFLPSELVLAEGHSPPEASGSHANDLSGPREPKEAHGA